MADKTNSTNEELRRQRNQARSRMDKLPSSGGFKWRSLSREKRVDVDRRRKTYRKVIARVDKLLGADQKAKAPPAKPKGKTPGEKLTKELQKFKPLTTVLQAAAKTGLKKKKNTNQD